MAEWKYVANATRRRRDPFLSKVFVLGCKLRTFFIWIGIIKASPENEGYKWIIRMAIIYLKCVLLKKGG